MSEQNAVKERNKTTSVVFVLGESRVALNRKPITDIQIDDRFQIYALTEEIFDPISNESLGRLKLYKGTGKIVDIQDTMVILQSDRERLGPGSLLSFGFPSEKIFMPFNGVKEGDLADRIPPVVTDILHSK